MVLNKSKIKDTNKDEKDFKWKKLKHEPQNLQCLHCKFDRAEQSLKDKIKDLNNNSKKNWKDINGISHTSTIQELKVLRGRYEDVIGWVISWQ